ncbi:related to translation activator GCN1 [Serendipita indica DSM 11827]|uniref:Related to translation activator GCN1 n=1 Tax=Serendipita indica (strain DSM 11827) TaxID=1109443 RepID=G4TSA9_SERID|nr:related to translation activator GCN1 [Serendipita indica DSM 11827]
MVELDEHFTKSPAWTKLVTAMALLLDLLLDTQVTTKEPLRKSAVVQQRRAIRSSPEHIKPLVAACTVSTGSTPSDIRNAPLIGTAYDVTLHLKDSEKRQQLLGDLKTPFLQFYIGSILSSKTAPPTQSLNAFVSFIGDGVDPGIFSTQLMPVIEKMLLRSPEVCLPTITSLFQHYKLRISSDEFKRLLTSILNCSKSSNPLIRTGAVQLWRALISRDVESSDLKYALDIISAPVKTGKSNGVDHRQALYSMIPNIPSRDDLCVDVAGTTFALWEKETSEVAISTLAEASSSHLADLLRRGTALGDKTESIIVKEAASVKPAQRRAMLTLIGEAFWALHTGGDSQSESASALLKKLESGLLKLLKDASISTVVQGVVDHWIALLLVLRQTGSSTHSSTLLQGILFPSGKPSFLYSEKNYQKVDDPKEAIWLLRVLDTLTTHSDDLVRQEKASLYFGQTLLWLAVDHPSPTIRRETLSTLKRLSAAIPVPISNAINLASNNLLFGDSKQAKEEESSPHRSLRLSAALLSSANLANQVEEVKEKLIVDLFLVSHHPVLSRAGEALWIELAQHAQLDPHLVVTRHLDALKSTVDEGLAFAEGKHRDSALRALGTLTLVAPVETLPIYIERASQLLDPTPLHSLGEFELGVWATPAGTAFLDVLANKKGGSTVEKGKDAKIKQWEDEVRKSLAQKKAAAPTLSKQEKALVDAQLEKEEAVRARLKSIQKNIKDGLSIIKAILASRTEQSEMSLHILASLLMRGVVQLGAPLVEAEAIQTYLEIFDFASDRLDTLRIWVGVANLRANDVEHIPERYTGEPLNSLVGRLLYRIKSLSEQTPFDGVTFSLFWPTLHRIVEKGGVSVETEDDAVEQMLLSLEIIRAHSSQFSDPLYPRQSICETLVHLIANQPKVSRDAVSGLLEATEAMRDSATETEKDQLVQSTLSQEVFVRNACLQALQSFDFTERDWIPAIWLACHDEDDQNANLARQLWVENGLDVPEDFLSPLLSYLSHTNSYVRRSSAASFTESLESWPTSSSGAVLALQDYYREKAKLLVPEYDQFGMVIPETLDRKDPWEARLAVADAFHHMAESIPETDVESLFKFFIEDEALGDRHGDVRRRMLEAGMAVIQLHGKSRLPGLISIFETHLGSSKPTATDTGDHIRQAVVILLGGLAQHLEKTDPRVKEVVNRLIEALKTPSEVVQESVADCLTPLAPLVEDEASDLIDRLYAELTTSPKYASRRGAAYGIAGIIRGIGIIGIQRFNIIRRLRDAAADKKSYEARQGASFALETLARILGRGFEPYVVQLLPLILTSFGDANPEVREATIDASKVIMGKLSGYGVKQIMPKVMEGLEERQWRTKKGSVELLGSMAFCAPKQLSSALPTVVPQLTLVLTDSHAQVRAAGSKSLKQFGEVISNPEIHSLVPTLLKALVDPEKTPNALSALLKKSFVHYIDSASLAIVIPIIERGLRERGADTKRKATQIVGQMAGLTDSKDFIPYLSRLLPLVHTVLVDPVPEARATAAKALGTLVERLGEGQFPDLVQDLLKTLRSDTSGVDRQGAAQGLSEVLSGLGMERLEGLLPDIISSTSSPRSYVREGFMSLLVYLPATFGTRFQPHLAKIIPPILRGLADTEEYVREASMKAGRMIVVNYSSKAVDLLLPELELGIFDSGWRIRQSSITLIGELLFRLSGISGKAELEEEEEEADAVVAESSRKVLIDILGKERRDRVLGALYLVRQDAVAAVRSASIHIWKALVSNTPRTVREILPTLMNQIVDLLSMPHGDQRETAARTIGELCRKFGERILGDMLPILQRGSKSSDTRIREGVCLAMSEIISNSTDTQREDHEDEIIGIVRRSLVDNASNVRAAAAVAFDVLQDVMGAKAIDETIPTLLEALRQPGESSGTALQALKEVMTVRASTVFPVLIPTLISTPMTAFNARALASLVTVAGNALSKRLTVILTALIRAVEHESDDELKESVQEAVSALLGSIGDMEGLQTLMLLLAGWVKNESWNRRVSALHFFETFCKVATIDFSLYRPDWVRYLVSLMDDRQEEVHRAAVAAFEAFVKSIEKDELDSVVVTLRRTIESTGAPGRTVPGFNLKGSVSSMVPIVIAGLTGGNNEQREQAAYAIGDLVERTEESAFKPYVVPFTGPLIRVATQATAFPPGVKVAILKSLTTMLEHIPAHVKPFFPQLSRTFVKSCSDPSSLAVRNAAAKALGTLTKSSQIRIDGLVTELITTAQGADDDAIAASMILALAYVVRHAIGVMNSASKEACLSVIESAFRERHDDPYLHATATLFTSLETEPELLRPIVQSNILQGRL